MNGQTAKQADRHTGRQTCSSRQLEHCEHTLPGEVSKDCCSDGIILSTPAAMDTIFLPASPAVTSCTARLASQERQASTTPARVRQQEWAAPAAMATAWGRLISLCPLWKAMSPEPPARATSLAPTQQTGCVIACGHCTCECCDWYARQQ